jgi:hypothetical protein
MDPAVAKQSPSKLRQVLGGAAVVVVGGAALVYFFRLDPCKELARIKLEEHWAKESGAPPWYPGKGEREKYMARKLEMEQRCTAQKGAG